MKKAIRFLIANEGLVLLLTLVFVLRIPSWYEPYWYGDEGIYLVLGQALRQGFVWYKDIHDNKPPLLYFLAALSGSVFYFRLLLTIWFGLAVVIFFNLVKKLLPKKPIAWYAATLSLIIVTTLFEGNVANAEVFMVLPTVIGMQLVLSSKKWLQAGFWFSLAFLLKVPAVFDFGAAWLWLKGLKGKTLTTIGFMLPILATLAYYAIAGGFEPYLRSALLQNVGYLSSWGGSNQGLLIRAGLTAFFLVIFWLWSKKWRLDKNFQLIVAWFLLALFGALLSARPYPHYLIQPAVPAAILFGYWFASGKRAKQALVALVLIAATAYIKIGFWHYSVIGYYQNFLSYAFNNKDLISYQGYFDPRVPQVYALADYLKQTTMPEERVFIWGDEPMVYALAKRLPPGRYTVAYHVVDFNGFDETMTAFVKNPPKVVILPTYESRPFPALKDKIASDYVYTTQIGEALIYRRLNGDTAEIN